MMEASIAQSRMLRGRTIIMMTVDKNLISMEKVADSGQCFRMSVINGGIELFAYGRRLFISRNDEGDYALDCPQGDFDGVWKDYFDLDGDYAAYENSVPAEDEFMLAAVSYGKGIRILRQEPWEMLISFIISQRKNIPAIRSCIAKLCERFGEKIEGGYAFPTPASLARLDEAALAECSLGYRTGYILSAARMVDSGDLDLDSLYSVDYADMLARLMAVPGVGPKVARCVMLFGYHRLEAFPRDVWINRVVDTHYAGNFPEQLYPGFAGVMQQYAFYYARSFKI
ncbi:MAG: DNA glycosylase [Clostridia bacterium]|nr:DNA glycosylase [Clostridia bacterium]